MAAGYAGDVDGLDIINTHFALARYRPDGSLDTSFGEEGKTLTGLGSDSSVEDVAIQRDGKIIAAGYGHTTSKRSAFALARYRKDGSLDAGFGNGGKVITDFGSR